MSCPTHQYYLAYQTLPMGFKVHSWLGDNYR
jgi:hypothetical protein